MRFTLLAPEHVAALQANPYVDLASGRTVAFTAEFKEFFWKEYQAGRVPDDILKSVGIDPSILGSQRVTGLSWRIRKEALSTEGFRARSTSQLKKANKPDAAVPADNAALDKVQAGNYNQLVHRVAFLEQEIEFLKKIMSAGSGRKST